MFNNNDSHDLGGTSNDHSGGHDRGTQRNESNTDIGGGCDARKRPGGRLTNREPSSSIYAPRLSIDSIGFKNYLRNFLKIKANIIKSEILKEAVSRYQLKYGGNRHGGRRRHHRSPRPSDPINYAEEFQYEKLYAEQVDDECGENKCKPKDDESLGFKNYFKMFRCRFPDMDKCKALKKAKCIYENLSERTKQKYRDLGCDFKCCARRKAQPQCPPPNKCKPKRKPRNKCPPKPCPPKPCPPKPCPMDSSSSSMSVTESESDESSSSCDLKAQKRCSKPKQNPCCAPPKRAAPPKKPFCP